MLGIPTAGAPSAPFVESLRGLVLPPEVTAFERAVVTGNFIPAQRDLLIERALAWEADQLVMCDDDMVVPADALVRLSELLGANPNIAVAGALYYSRDGLRPMVVDGWDPHDTARGWIPAFERAPVAVDGVGSGCMAIRLQAVEGFDRPFFPAHVFVEPAQGRVRVCDEDYLFCARVRSAGFAVFLHAGVRCGHYDRSRDRIAPQDWEPVELTNRRRVLTRTGERYELLPLSGAPPARPGTERQRRADVVYVESIDPG